MGEADDIKYNNWAQIQGCMISCICGYKKKEFKHEHSSIMISTGPVGTGKGDNRTIEQYFILIEAHKLRVLSYDPSPRATFQGSLRSWPSITRVD
jgi:hypothetical protein